MFSINNIYAQQAVDFYGMIGNMQNSEFRLNSLESNIANFNSTKNWEFSISTSAFLGQSSNVNLTGFSLGKKLNKHYLYMRYTPGIFQEFVFNSRTEFVIGDTIQTYKTDLVYKEKYGFGYSYSFNNQISAGFVLRYFQQEFGEEFPIFSTLPDSQLIDRGKILVDKNFWRADFGINYRPIKEMQLTFGTQNIIVLNEYKRKNENSEFEIEKKSFDLKQNKGIQIGINYFPYKNFGFGMMYESSSSFIAGLNFNTFFDNSTISVSTVAFHDKYQIPFIAGVQPALNYTSNLFSITLSYLKYFSDRKTNRSVDDFRSKGIRNIRNNYFNPDKINLSLNFALSFQKEQQVKFLDVDIKDEIYPTFKNNYIDHPFAIGKVVNLTDEKVTIKPASLISDINHEKVFSPMITIEPFDTLEIPFFTIIDDSKSDLNKTKISQAWFYLTTKYDEPDDKLQKPLLVNSKNSWDGNVNNLRYFVKSDIDFSHKYAKGILVEYKDSLNHIAEFLKPFKKIEILFNKFVENMTYVSDRRATSDYVQFPSETIEIKGGDCDDLSVCFSSILEGVGIQTAFLDYKPNHSIGHVSLLVNLNIPPEMSELITINDKKYFTRKNVDGKEEVWIPIETTSLTNFKNSWNIGSKEFYSKAIDDMGLSKNKVEIVDIF